MNPCRYDIDSLGEPLCSRAFMIVSYPKGRNRPWWQYWVPAHCTAARSGQQCTEGAQVKAAIGGGA